MSARPIALEASGLVTSVGLNTATTCAALRCRLNHFDEMGIDDLAGEPLIGAAVAWPETLRGVRKLARMAASAVVQALTACSAPLATIPVILCVAETGRAGRMEDLDAQLFESLAREFGHALHADSGILPAGQLGLAFALNHARDLIYAKNHRQVLVVAADTLLNRSTVLEHLEAGRLLATDCASGFIPGEAAAALLLMRPDPQQDLQLLVQGLGAARETVLPGSDQPFRADAMSAAITAALAESGIHPPQCELIVADVSGEQYFFEELVLAQQRTGLAGPVWLPAECLGETGSAAGCIGLAWLLEAAGKGYVPGQPVLLLARNDAGQRAAVVATFQFGQAYLARTA